MGEVCGWLLCAVDGRWCEADVLSTKNRDGLRLFLLV